MRLVEKRQTCKLNKWVLSVACLLLYISLLHSNPVCAEFLDVNDPKLLAIREHIIKAYYLRPDPINHCAEERHHAAVRLFTRLASAKDQNDIMEDIQALIVRNEDNYFVGLPETLAASSKIQYIIYWDKLMINSATYRNPLSGRTVTLHTLFSPSTVISLNYTEPETGCFMELVNCYPFPKWVLTYYRDAVPRITRLSLDGGNATGVRNLFVRVSDGIGGKFTETVLFADNKWLLEVYRTSSVRKSILLRGFQKSSTTAASPLENKKNSASRTNETLQTISAEETHE